MLLHHLPASQLPGRVCSPCLLVADWKKNNVSCCIDGSPSSLSLSLQIKLKARLCRHTTWASCCSWALHARATRNEQTGLHFGSKGWCERGSEWEHVYSLTSHMPTTLVRPLCEKVAKLTVHLFTICYSSTIPNTWRSPKPWFKRLEIFTKSSKWGS